MFVQACHDFAAARRHRFRPEKGAAMSDGEHVRRLLEQRKQGSSSASRPPVRRSHLDSEIARSGHLVHKLKAKDTTGRWAFYFVYVPALREQQFLDALHGDGTIDLETYGKVIASCYGEGPSEEVCAFLKEKYGFNVAPKGG